MPLLVIGSVLITLLLVFPLLNRFKANLIGYLASGVLLLLFIYTLTLYPEIIIQKPIAYETSWVPTLGFLFSLRLDGLSFLFTAIILGIGSMIFLYAAGYMGQTKKIPLFWSALLAFTIAMLGIVVSNDLILLFIFWELTSISSFLLIGHKHHDQTARQAAKQALLVTALGGLAMLAGFILLAHAAGTMQLSEIITQKDLIQHPHFNLIVILVLLGIFSKSAQIPFHFWLPNAMAAPTPISAYLHSATMVKAGIYLLFRLHPLMGSTWLWSILLIICGGLTSFYGAVLALQQTDLKRILAYSTLSVLGLLTFLLGLQMPIFVVAALIFLVAHSLYKATLFMSVGVIDLQTKTRDSRKIKALRHTLPLTALGALIAGAFMAGIPPLYGFVSKEFLLTALVETKQWLALIVIGLIAIIFAIIAFLVGWHPYYSKDDQPQNYTTRLGKTIQIPIVALASLSLIFVFFLQPFSKLINTVSLQLTTTALAAPLAIWHGWTGVFGLSLLLLLLGFLGYRVFISKMHTQAKKVPESFADRVFSSLEDSLKIVASTMTHIFYPPILRQQMRIMLAIFVVLIVLSFVWDLPIARPLALITSWYDLISFVLIFVFTIATLLAKNRLSGILYLGGVGLGVSLFFAFHHAPDLAFTQILIETLTLVLFILAFRKLPMLSNHSTKRARYTDLTLAGAVGFVFATITFIVSALATNKSTQNYYLANSLDLANGRNVVNVILVDFRALDTLGEITVLAIAAMGIVALLAQHEQHSQSEVKEKR